MKIKHGTIDLTAVANDTYTNSNIIDVSQVRNGNFSLWTAIVGDSGKTGSGVSVTWDGNFQNSGTTYFVIPTDTAFIRSSGTSVDGPSSNGIDIATFQPDLVASIRLKARHNGSGTTSTAKVHYALMMD